MLRISKDNIYKKVVSFFLTKKIELSGSLVLSVSGGRDSMCLYTVFLELRRLGRIKSFRVVHFNHELRKESEFEAITLKRMFMKDDVEFNIVKLDLESTRSNIENVAREARYHYFSNELASDEICCFGHHLDDHFEWSMMRLFRSGESDILKGMPRYRHPFARPLSSVSRQEISEFCERYNIKYFDDHSNNDDFSDRNYVRNHIGPLIKKRFPNYLNFYESRQNVLEQMYLRQEENDINKSTSVEESARLLNVAKDLSLIYVKGELGVDAIDLLKIQIKSHSSVKRGSLTRELEKLVAAYNSFKTGPMLFSGNVYCWLNRPFIIIFKLDMISRSTPIKVKNLKKLKNRSIFISLLENNADFSPFISFDNESLNEIKKLKVKKLPKMIQDKVEYTQIYSIGAVFCALPDK
jgi:tRNA(Ile)-lysidine synthase